MNIDKAILTVSTACDNPLCDDAICLEHQLAEMVIKNELARRAARVAALAAALQDIAECWPDTPAGAHAEAALAHPGEIDNLADALASGGDEARCERCGGTGVIPFDDTPRDSNRCPACGGRGHP